MPLSRARVNGTPAGEQRREVVGAAGRHRTTRVRRGHHAYGPERSRRGVERRQDVARLNAGGGRSRATKLADSTLLPSPHRRLVSMPRAARNRCGQLDRRLRHVDIPPRSARSAVPPDGSSSGRQAVLYAADITARSRLPPLIGLTGPPYLSAAPGPEQRLTSGQKSNPDQGSSLWQRHPLR